MVYRQLVLWWCIDTLPPHVGSLFSTYCLSYEEEREGELGGDEGRERG